MQVLIGLGRLVPEKLADDLEVPMHAPDKVFVPFGCGRVRARKGKGGRAGAGGLLG